MYDPFREVERRLQVMERRLENMIRVVKVTDVDPKEGVAKVKDGEQFATDWVPWSQRAGNIKDWQPPTKDEQAILFSPSGDPEQGWLHVGGFSDQFPAPHDKADEHVLSTIGQMRIEATGSKISLKVGGAELTIEAGKITAKVGGSEFTVEAGEIKAKSTKITTDGATHLDNGDPQVLTLAGPAARVYAKV
jgi:phage baseplate assembly protein V